MKIEYGDNCLVQDENKHKKIQTGVYKSMEWKIAACIYKVATQHGRHTEHKATYYKLYLGMIKPLDMFFYTCPPVRGICKNHGVVMFQSQIVTPPYLGSVLNWYVI